MYALRPTSTPVQNSVPSPKPSLPSTLYPLPSTLYPLPSTLYPLPSTLYPLPCLQNKVNSMPADVLCMLSNLKDLQLYKNKITEVLLCVA